MIEARDQTCYKLVEAEAMWSSQVKIAEVDPTRVVKEVMDSRTMQFKVITVREMADKNEKAVESLRDLLAEFDLMIEEEKAKKG